MTQPGTANPGDRPQLRFEMDRLLSYDDDSLLEELRRVAALVPETVLTKTAYDNLSMASSSAICRRFGSWREALHRAGLEHRYSGTTVSSKMLDQRARSATQADMILELQRIARLVGRTTITRKDVEQHSNLMAPGAMINRFGSWQAALEAAGLKLSNMGRRHTEDDYFDNLLVVWTHHGRRPTYAEMNLPPSTISNGAYANRFGTWGKAQAAFVEQVNSDLAEVQNEAQQPAPAIAASFKPKIEDRRHIPVGLRYQVLKRDRFRCVTCGRSPASNLGCELHVDHVLAFSRGGKTNLQNLRTLCADCNLGKGDRDA